MKRFVIRVYALTLVAATSLAAQGIRISGVTSVQYIELRPFVTDSLPIASVPGTGENRVLASGTPAVCSETTGVCRVLASGERVGATPMVQDLTLAGWGWVTGLSFHANVRARTNAGGAFAWPRADDHFDVVDAYAELERGAWRARAGRQWITGGLGAYNYDGASASVRRDAYTLDGWAGRALVAGLNDPYTSAELAAVDNLPPDKEGFVLGVRGRYRPGALTTASLMYQRVLVSDRSGLYSERAAFDASVRRFGLQADAALTYDLAFGDWNEARLRVSTTTMPRAGASLEVRRSRPYFDLWTIWGAFAPVGYDEVRSTAYWRPEAARVTLSLRGAYRTYAPTEAGFDLRTNGWRAGADAVWTPGERVFVTGSYDLDIGSGAAGSDARLGARWMLPHDASVGADLSATQNIYEFRVGTGRILGAAMTASTPLTADTRLSVDAGFYQHALTRGAPGPDWTQRRVSARFEWTVGRDPGMPR
jgi:hypothetical protein